MAQLVGERDELDCFLAHNSALPWSPGKEVDCCLCLAAWIMWLGYPDPAAHLRGTYSAGQGQIDVLVAGGGAAALVEHCVRGFAARVVIPRRGNIGVVGSAKNPARQFGVIHDGGGWLTRTASGFSRVSARTLSAWKI